MENPFDATRRAVSEAKATLRAADNISSDMANLLVGRLRLCRGFGLAKLKKELAQFNAHTGRWNK